MCTTRLGNVEWETIEYVIFADQAKTHTISDTSKTTQLYFNTKTVKISVDW